MSKETYKVILEEEIVSEKDVVVGGVYELVVTDDYNSSFDETKPIVCIGLDEDEFLNDNGYPPPIFRNIGDLDAEDDVIISEDGNVVRMCTRVDYISAGAKLIKLGELLKGDKQDEQ